MHSFLKKTYPLEFSRRRRLRFAIWGAIAIFLFILFFQPFGIEQTDFNNYILLIAGFAGIAFLVYIIVHLPIPWSSLSIKLGQYNLNVLLLFELLIWILNTVAFAFYLRYVGKINLSIFLVFRIAMITLFQLVINMLLYELYDLKQRLNISDSDYSRKDIKGKTRENILIFNALTGSEQIKLNLEDLILLRSAENYVEFHFLEGGSLQKKLLRTTLRKVEEQLDPFSTFIRCHRNSIVNLNFVKKLRRSADGFKLELEDYDAEVTVSRQYLLQVRNALERDN